ncbi:glutamate receptor-interacting protein 1-like isoform X2 [Centruroides sculpturatus]|uniref:glutamate receptor-interacting protein 1-like isoform X1 n=1 Tax=Centruroides sculpturatus TaxID=218467 RepID=UPI000C6E2FBB|nr:glutamate receptor-interacting protein 1-like isoform X1 [Centruroides sculpturatus]XP_023221787.1 glutamate receptor-interacting protein 1-like isoform X2 [Centruroides sculpturatus]
MAKNAVVTVVSKVLQFCGKRESLNDRSAVDNSYGRDTSEALAIDRMGFVSEEKRGTSIVELVKEGHTLGLTISGGIDKGCHPHISNLRPGSIAHRCDALAVGDYIVSINGIRTNKLKHDEIVNLLKNAEEKVTLEVEYEIPTSYAESSPCVCPKVIQIKLEKETGSFGFTLRGGACLDRLKSRPLTITNVRFGGPADREGTIKAGDRLLAVDSFNLTLATLQEAMSILKQVTREALFTLEYDVSILDAVNNASGPLLVEIDKTPGSNLGITLTRLPKPENKMVIESIKQASIAERCGALHVGDHILSIDGTKVDQMTPAEAMQLLKVNVNDMVKLEILPARQIAIKRVPDVNVRRGALMPPVPSYMPSVSSFNTLSSFGRQSFSSYLSNQPFHSTRKWSGCNDNTQSSLPLSCVSNASLVLAGVSGQVCHTDTTQVTLCADYCGFGFSLRSSAFATELLTSPPVICSVDPGGMAEKTGVIQVGDRVLAVNNKCTKGMTTDEVMHLIQQSHPRVTLDIEFDVAESVVPSSGTFTVKLAKKGSGLGITIATPKNRQSGNLPVISDIKKGSSAHRIGTLQPGDKLLAIDSVSMDNCSFEDAAQILQNCDNIVKLRVQKDDSFSEDPNSSGNIVYTVELVRHGGPLGITISGSEEPFEPITISGLTEDGLAERTGAIHIGDRLLAINGQSLCGKPLSEAITLLQNSDDSVTLKISKRSTDQNNVNKAKENRCFIDTTPISSIDSAVESWASCGLDLSVNGMQTRPKCDAEYCDLVCTPTSLNIRSAYDDKFQASLKRSDHLSENWELKTTSSQSYASSAVSEEEKADWSKVLEDLETCGQSQLLRQIEKTIMGSDPSVECDRQDDAHRNQLRYFCEESPSLSDTRDVNGEREERKQGGRDGGSAHYPEAYSVPVPIEVHRVTLFKDQIYEDFGFSVSDGLYERGVYINRIRARGPADLSGLLRPLDRILQVNDTKTHDFDCCLTVPLIASAGDRIELVISRPAYDVDPLREGIPTDQQPWVDDDDSNLYSSSRTQSNNNQMLTKTL